jgi:hypothetical protein
MAPMIIGAAAILVAVAVNALVVVKQLPHAASPVAKMEVSLAPLVGLLIIVPIFLYERSLTSQFQIETNCLVLGRKRFPLEGVVEIRRDPDIMRWAVKTLGNGGLGAIRGRFWSKRVGKFYAFLTGTENAVVLRWPDRVVAVSPADPEFFMYSARLAAGLK